MAVCGRVHVYTTVYTAVYGRCIRPQRGHVQVVKTAIYTTRTRPCTGCVHVCTAVYTAVYVLLYTDRVRL